MTDPLSSCFNDDDITSMTTKFEAGSTIKIIAEEHKIGTTSLKRIIRERGARRRDSRTASFQ